MYTLAESDYSTCNAAQTMKQLMPQPGQPGWLHIKFSTCCMLNYVYIDLSFILFFSSAATLKISDQW